MVPTDRGRVVMGIFEGDWPGTPWDHEIAVEEGGIPPPADGEAKPSMHAFIDDSGCSGFKFGSGSTVYTIMAAAVFSDPAEIEKLASVVADCKKHSNVRTEFKYSGIKHAARDCFFQCTREVSYALRALVVDKRTIYSDKLLEGRPLKAWMIRQLLTHTFGTVRNAKIVVDGQDTRGFGIDDQLYLKEKVNRESPGVVHSVKFDDSKDNVGIQLADMTAGAVARAYEPRRRRSPEHLALIRPRTFRAAGGSLWYFRDPRA